MSALISQIAKEQHRPKSEVLRNLVEKGLTETGAKMEDMIAIKCWEKASRGADAILKKRLKELRAKLIEYQVSVELMTDQEITYLCKVFADLTTYQDSSDEIYEDIPLLPQKKRFLTTRSAESGDSVALQDLLTPVGGISFGVSKVTIGPVVGRIYGAMRFPSELDYAWAVDLMNNSDCVTSITYYPGNTAELGDALARSIKTADRDAASETNPRRRKHFNKQAVDADQLIEEMDFKNAPIGHVAILAMPFSDREDKLEDICRSVSNRFAKKRISLKPLGNLQKDGYKHLSPYYPPQPLVEDVLKRIFPLETLMGGFPMIVSLYRDDHGNYFARMMDGSVMALNLLSSMRRTSSLLIRSRGVVALFPTDLMVGICSVFCTGETSCPVAKVCSTTPIFPSLCSRNSTGASASSPMVLIPPRRSFSLVAGPT